MPNIINNRDFLKSSLSHGKHTCVGVSIEKNDVAVINTNKHNKMVNFTHEEWNAFVAGVKNGEFDL